MQSLARRFDMPTVFGPSLLPDTSNVRGARVAAISFETDAEAARRLLPKGLEPTEVPVVSVTRITYPSVEYLGGRGYNEIVVAVSARARDSDGIISAGYAPVMWVDQVGALISGREYMGFAKLFGEMTVMDLDGLGIGFDCREYGTPLLSAQIDGLKPIGADTLERINRATQEVVTLGWKYIPSAHGAPDADYALANVTRWTYARAWSGTGRIEFFAPDANDAPFSSRVVATLKTLPVKAYRPAFVAEGDVVIDRTATRRLVG